MRKAILSFIGLICVIGSLVAAGAANAIPASQIRIGGVGFSSLGTGALDITPGVESVILLNYSWSAKNLKGYVLQDKGGNVVPLCKGNEIGDSVIDCTSLTADHDRAADVAAYIPTLEQPVAPVIFNKNDSDAWVTLPARSQLSLNVEARNDGPWLNDGGDTLVLRNSVGRILTRFEYKVSNPTD